MQLHPETLIVNAALVTPLISAAQLFLWWIFREPALRWWAAGTLAIFVSTVFQLAAPLAPAYKVPGTLTLVLGYGLFLYGINVSQQDRISRRVLLGALMITLFITLGANLYSQENGTGVASLMSGLLAGGCAYALIRQHPPGIQASSAFTGIAFLLSSVLHLGAFLFGLPGAPTESQWTWVHAGDFVLLIGWSFGFLMLTAQRHYAQVTELANHDELTGIDTRRAFMEKARHAFAVARRTKSPLALLMLDIDFFKQVNDAHGHATGDEVLRRFAQTASRCLRNSDLFGRIGGEEFCVVLPDTDIDGAGRLAERVRAGFAAERVEKSGHSVVTTVSIGVVAYNEQCSNLDDLIATGDKALYRAKAEGRNRVSVEVSSGPAPPAIHLAWTGQYQSGNSSIDHEHEYLIGWANALLRKLQEHADAELIQADFKEMLFWLQTHFRNEEKILADAGWVGLTHHAKLHKSLAEKGNALLTGIEEGKDNCSALLDFLVMEIIAGHLSHDDAAFFDCLKSAAALRSE